MTEKSKPDSLKLIQAYGKICGLQVACAALDEALASGNQPCEEYHRRVQQAVEKVKQFLPIPNELATGLEAAQQCLDAAIKGVDLAISKDTILKTRDYSSRLTTAMKPARDALERAIKSGDEIPALQEWQARTMSANPDKDQAFVPGGALAVQISGVGVTMAAGQLMWKEAMNAEAARKQSAEPSVCANNPKLFPGGLPNNQNIIDLVVFLDSFRASGETKNEVARSFGAKRGLPWRGKDSTRSLLAAITRLERKKKITLDYPKSRKQKDANN